MAQASQQHPKGATRRTVLVQRRARETRRLLIRAAVQLWTERGFGAGVDDTRVDEIAALAGVSKGTFYFHFAHKEDIFAELGWATAEALYDEAIRESAGRRSGPAVLQQLMRSFACRVEAMPRAAVLRSVTSFYGWPAVPVPTGGGRHGIQEAIELVVKRSVARGELAPGTDVRDVAEMITALMMEACFEWAQGASPPLAGVLRRRLQVIMAGVRAVAAPPVTLACG